MRVLMVMPHIPYPPRRGAAIRNYYFLRWLSERHHVSLLTFGEPDDVPSHLNDLCAEIRVVPRPARSTGDRVRDLVSSSAPDLALRLRSEPLARALLEWIVEGRFDAVQVECLETTWSWLWAQSHLPGGVCRPHAIFDNHNAEHLLQWRAFRTDVRSPRRWPVAAYSLIQTLKLRTYERRLLKSFDRLIAVSSEDANALRELDSNLRFAVIANGVDCSVLPFKPADDSAQRPQRVVFTGTMDYRPNVDASIWFAREVWPSVRTRVPGAEFYIVGANPTPAVCELSEVPGVTVTGAVEDVRPYLESSRVYVVPMRIGGGVRLKVLEAMASGLPLVSTSLGCEGVVARPGEHYLLADGAERFAKAVGDVLLGELSLQPMLSAARGLVEQRYDWSVLSPGLGPLLDTALP